MLWWWKRKLASKHVQVRKTTVEQIGSSGNPKAIALLEIAIKDAEPSVCKAAIDALKQLSLDVKTIDLEHIARLLNHVFNDKFVEIDARKTAIEALVALGLLAKPEQQERLRHALSDRDFTVRQMAAEALEQQHWVPADASQRALFAIAKGDYARAMEEGAVAIEGIETALGEYRIESELMQIAVLDALRRICDQRVVPILLRVVGDMSYPINTRKVAITALGDIGNADACLPLLKTASERPDDLRAEAVEAVSKLKAPQLEDTLITLLHENMILAEKKKGFESWVETIVTILGRIGGQQSGTVLLRKFAANSIWGEKQKRIFQDALEQIRTRGWTPQNDRERLLYALFEKRYEDTIPEGEIALEYLISYGLPYNSKSEINERVINALKQINAEKAVEMIKEQLDRAKTSDSANRGLFFVPPNTLMDAAAALGHPEVGIIEHAVRKLGGDHRTTEDACRQLVDLGTVSIKPLVQILQDRQEVRGIGHTNIYTIVATLQKIVKNTLADMSKEELESVSQLPDIPANVFQKYVSVGFSFSEIRDLASQELTRKNLW